MPSLAFYDNQGSYAAGMINGGGHLFDFPGATFDDQVSAARAFLQALDNAGDLTNATQWIFTNLTANPWSPPGTAWNLGEAADTLRFLLTADGLIVNNQTIAAAAFAAAEGMNPCADLAELVAEDGSGQFVATVLEIMLDL